MCRFVTRLACCLNKPGASTVPWRTECAKVSCKANFGTCAARAVHVPAVGHCRGVARHYGVDVATRHEHRATAGQDAPGRLAYRARRRVRARTPGTRNRGRNRAFNPLLMQGWSSFLACLHAHQGSRRMWGRLSGRAGMPGSMSDACGARGPGNGCPARQELASLRLLRLQPLPVPRRDQPTTDGRSRDSESACVARHCALAPSSAWQLLTRSVRCG